MKAVDQRLHIDLRRRRAQSLTHVILRAVEPHIHDRDALREISHALETAFRNMGVEVLTDDLRDELGLPPRGPDGWTAEELFALENRRLAAMSAATPIIVELSAALESVTTKRRA